MIKTCQQCAYRTNSDKGTRGYCPKLRTFVRRKNPRCILFKAKGVK